MQVTDSFALTQGSNSLEDGSRASALRYAARSSPGYLLVTAIAVESL